MTNIYQAAPGNQHLKTKLQFDLIIDSHNFGKIEGENGFSLGQSVLGFSFQKTINGPGSLTLELAPDCEWLDVIQANDYVNFYVNISTGESDTIYNRGWVRLFFGFVDDVRRLESTGANGAVIVRYQLSATDAYKVLANTTVFNHPAIPGTEIFGWNIAGVADSLFRLGVIVSGSPKFMLMHNLYALLGYGRQWCVPPHYKDQVDRKPQQSFEYKGNYYSPIARSAESSVTDHLSDERISNDALKDIQNRRADVIKYIAARSSNLKRGIKTDAIKVKDMSKVDLGSGMVGTGVDSRTGKVYSNLVQFRELFTKDTTAMEYRGVVDKSLRAPEKYAQLTIDVEAPYQECRSLLDLISFDYMEATDGYYANTDLWHFKGTVLNMINTISNPVLNEFFFDLRPTIDFLHGGTDGTQHELDGGLVMVPSFVLREMPFTYHGDVIDVRDIRKEEFDFAMRGVKKKTKADVASQKYPSPFFDAGPFELPSSNVFTNQNIFGVRDIYAGVPTPNIRKDRRNTKIFFMDPCGAVWRQSERVVDYGKRLGFDFDAFWKREEEVTGPIPDMDPEIRYKNLIRYDRGPRTFEHIEITSNDVISANLGRGDQDAVTGYDCVPLMSPFRPENVRAYARDYTPQFRMLLIRRHGLRFIEHQSSFVISDYPFDVLSDKYKSGSVIKEGVVDKVKTGLDDWERQTYPYWKGKIEVNIPGVGSAKAENIFNSVEWYMNMKITIMRDMWDQHNTEYLNGSIVLRPFPGLRVGYRLDWKDRDLSFYVIGVSHSGAFGGRMVTTVSVVRGQPMSKSLPYYLPDNRTKQEKSDGFKLGMPFSVAEPADGVNNETGERFQFPGEPGNSSLTNLFQNWRRVNIKITFPSGVNTGGEKQIQQELIAPEKEEKSMLIRDKQAQLEK